MRERHRIQVGVHALLVMSTSAGWMRVPGRQKHRNGHRPSSAPDGEDGQQSSEYGVIQGSAGYKELLRRRGQAKREPGPITTDVIFLRAGATVLPTTLIGGYGTRRPPGRRVRAMHVACPYNSRALENANDDTRRVFSSRISVRVIGG